MVVHDPGSQTIVHIANNLSRRAVGDATALDDIEFSDDDGLIGAYAKRNWDGGAMRAISVLIRSDAGTPIGVMCVNVASSAFEQARATLEFLTRGFHVEPQPDPECRGRECFTGPRCSSRASEMTTLPA